eukprot:GHVR01058456.1.p1 GENE.GHVR01058456.1~~GHVR01058456.1.p1  ORF type:complete len:148 (-),score=18.01 GHVR01058456.1:514-957(-)
MEHELNLAARRGFVYDVKALVEKGLDVNFKSGANETPLHIASRSGHIDVVKFLIGRGAYVDPLNVLSFLAAQHDRACVVKWLVDKGAKINLKDKKGDTALLVASRNNHLNTISVLINNGANINLRNSMGWTAVDAMIANSYPKRVKK